MLDQLKILLIFGSFSAVARGGHATSTIADNYNGKLSCPYVWFEPASHECYAGEPKCYWKNDPSASAAWSGFGPTDDAKRLSAYIRWFAPMRTSMRVISPIFSRDDNYSCISITYQTTVGLEEHFGIRVYQKPVHKALRDLIAYSDEAKKDYILFEVWGHQDDDWHTEEFPLKHFDSNFQIILEGILVNFFGYITVDYIALKRKTECKGQTTSQTISTTTTLSTTTTERAMRENGDTITDEVMTSDRWVDIPYATPLILPPASSLSNLWPTTTLPSTTQMLQEGNVRGEDYDSYEYNDEYTTTTTSTNSLPTSTSMTTNSQPTTTQRIVGDYDYDLACDFDGNGFCAWKNDPSANQSWLLNPLFDYDAVLNQDPEGYPFIFWNEPSPRGNSSIRLISPLYSRVLDKNGCFSTSFKMYTDSKSGLVGIRVYQKPDYIALEDLIAYNDEAKKDYILFEVWGDWGPYWYDKESTLKHFESNFQIILEGIFGEEPMYIAISYVSIMQRTDCTGNTAHPIPRPTTSTTISTTTTMLTTTTERPLRKNGDKTTDEGILLIPDGWEDSPSIITVADSPPESPISNLLPTTTRPTTKQPTTTQTLQEENGFDSRNTQMIISILAILGIFLLIFVCILAVLLARRRGTYRLNDIRATIVGASSFIDHEKKPFDARYSTKNGGDVVIDCNESKQQNTVKIVNQIYK